MLGETVLSTGYGAKLGSDTLRDALGQLGNGSISVEHVEGVDVGPGWCHGVFRRSTGLPLPSVHKIGAYGCVRP